MAGKSLEVSAADVAKVHIEEVHSQDNQDALFHRNSSWFASDSDTRSEPSAVTVAEGGPIRRDSINSTSALGQHIVGASLLDGCEEHLALCAQLFSK